MAKRWESETSDNGLPEKVGARVALVPVRESRFEAAAKGTGGPLSLAGMLTGAGVGTVQALRKKDPKALSRILRSAGTGWLIGAGTGALKGAVKPGKKLKVVGIQKSAEEIAVEAGARHALHKLAFGAKDMKRVLQVAKSKQLPKSAYKALMHPKLAPAGVARSFLSLSGVQSGKKALRGGKLQLARKVRAAKALGTPEGVISDLEGYSKGILKGFTKKLPPGGAIFQNQSAKKIFGRAAKQEGRRLPKLDPKESKALEAVAKGHELAETQVKASPAFIEIGHMSPDVLLREHNMIQTMPKRYKKVGDILRKQRQGVEAAVIREATGGRFRYGKGQRLSRHGRKHITRMVEETMRKKRLKHGLPE
jgi:hypothetical protein